jgi:hypothetical protein
MPLAGSGKKEAPKLNMRHELLIYAGNVIYLAKIYVPHRKTQKLSLVASREASLEVNATKTQYMLRSHIRTQDKSYHKCV